MTAVDLHHQHLQRRWGQEQGLVEERRQRLLLVAAGRAAEALRERWLGLQGVWLFGSALDASSFRRHSDLDLVVEGLPAAAQLEALGGSAVPLARTPAAAGHGPPLKPWRPLLPNNCVIWLWIWPWRHASSLPWWTAWQPWATWRAIGCGSMLQPCACRVCPPESNGASCRSAGCSMAAP